MTLYTERPRTIYFIRPIGMRGPIKIGCSYSPDRRRSTLETWSPFPLEIVAEMPGCMDDERRLHSLFRAQHKSREWFDWTPELQRVVDAVAAGRFDLTSLADAVPFPRSRPRNVATFKCPFWRFARSVDARLQSARKRGASWAEIEQLLGMEAWDFVRRLRDNTADAHRLRPRAAVALAELDRRFPPASRRKPLRMPESIAA